MMHILFPLLAALALSSAVQDDTPAREVAVAFAQAYEAGEPRAAEYVFYTSRHGPEMGATPEELKDELLPDQLRKNRRNPAECRLLEINFSPSDEVYGEDIYFAVYVARGNKHSLCLRRIDGVWKVDIAYLWMGDWYDWMPGY